MRKVLFSTLGMTDPIKNDHDGPFLHILRHYRPNKVYLFMTKRICELADQDNRYRVHGRKLCEEIGFNCEFIELRYDNIDNPQDFEIFYPIFERELMGIHNANQDCQILINLSSGTPQMKSSCNLLAFTTPFPVVPIQVVTPNESENYGSPDYKLDIYWENNLDNHPEMEPGNRAKQVNSDNLRYLFLREAAISNIEAYNYTAALNILMMVEEFVPAQVMHLIKAGKHRKNMDISEAKKESKLANYDILPKIPGDAQVLFEYLSLLGIQQKSGQLMDFVRGISPALTRLFECFLKEKCHRNVKRDYCESYRNDPDHWIIKRNKVGTRDPMLLAYYDLKFSLGFRDSDLSCSTLLPMIEFDCGLQGRFPNENALTRARGMRRVEDQIRNPAAHNITVIKEEQFKKVAGLSSEKLISDMQWMFKYCYPNYFNASENLWNSYDQMNEYIIGQLKAKK